MRDGLYHKEVFWKNIFDVKVLEFLKANVDKQIEWSFHVQSQQNDEWRRQYNLDDVTVSKILTGNVFEVEVKNNGIAKFVVRFKYNNIYDASIVLVPRGSENLFCKTIWFNRSDDNHRTLDSSKYIQND